MWRVLSEPETRLLRAMLIGASCDEAILEQLGSSRVVEMGDGGMGSLKFKSSGGEDSRLGETVSQAEFIDEDGVAVSATINLDQYGNLYELDVWKVDFSPLKRWPKPEDLAIR